MRTKSIIKTLISSAILQSIVVVSGLILPRLLIKYYGSEINGLISSIKQIVAYFSLVSLGLGSASSVALYKPLKDKDILGINSILSATRIFFKKTGYIFVGLILILSIVYPILIESNENSLLISAIVFILGTGGMVEYIIVSKYRILLIADQKNYISSWITAQGIIINTIVSIVLIYLKVSILIIQVTSVLVYILRLLLIKKSIKKIYPKVDFFFKPNFKAISGRWDAFFYQVPSMMIDYTPILLVTFYLGLESTSIYAVYNMIYSSIGMIISIFTSGINASFGNIMVSLDNNILQKSYNIYNYIFKIISFSIYTTTLILTIPFLKIYIYNSDGVNYILPTLALGFSINGLFKTIRSAPIVLVEAAGKFKENKILNLLEALVNIIISLILIKKFGINGIVLGGASVAFIRSILYVVYAEKNILMRNPKNELLKIVLNIILFIIIIKIFNNYNINLRIFSILVWIKLAIKSTITIFILFIVLNTCMDIKSSKDLLNRIKIILFYQEKNE